MLNVNRIINDNKADGFVMRSNQYLFTDEPFEIVSETQVNVPTDKGIILLDLSVSIDNEYFQNINIFCNYLYSL
jgi:hypothetical protein